MSVQQFTLVTIEQGRIHRIHPWNGDQQSQLVSLSRQTQIFTRPQSSKMGKHYSERLNLRIVAEPPMPTQAEQGRIFRELHQRDHAFIIPNPWDVGTARLLQSL